MGGGPAGRPALGEEPLQVGDGEPGWDGLEPYAVGEQVHDRGIGPERDGGTGPVRTEPELLAADRQVPG
jgi:hypothetical protein